MIRRSKGDGVIAASEIGGEPRKSGSWKPREESLPRKKE